MNDLTPSDFQVTIVGREPEAEAPTDGATEFAINQHSRRTGAVVSEIDELKDIWDVVIGKLTDLAAKSQVAAVASKFELEEIEFNIGIEAGLSVGLVTKGNASVSIKFSRKKPETQSVSV